MNKTQFPFWKHEQKLRQLRPEFIGTSTKTLRLLKWNKDALIPMFHRRRLRGGRKLLFQESYKILSTGDSSQSRKKVSLIPRQSQQFHFQMIYIIWICKFKVDIIKLIGYFSIAQNKELDSDKPSTSRVHARIRIVSQQGTEETIFTPNNKTTKPVTRFVTSKRKRKRDDTKLLLRRILDTGKNFEWMPSSKVLSFDGRKPKMEVNCQKDIDLVGWNTFVKFPDYSAIPRLNKLLSPKEKPLQPNSPSTTSLSHLKKVFGNGVSKQRLNRIMYRKR